MCSVFGYIGKHYSRRLVLQGLSRLEYRGYDSAGFACLDPERKQLRYVKAQGQLSALESSLDQNPIDGFISIGHTRWATHGGFALENAHPHLDCHKKIALMHNGIIENHLELRGELINQGHHFYSQTDTEIIAHLIEREVERNGLTAAAIARVCQQLEGAYAIVAIFQDYPDTMVVARKRSPLCIGIGSEEYFIASDPLAFADKSSTVMFMPDDSYALITRSEVNVYQADGTPIVPQITRITLDQNQPDKKGYEHFMLKEIHEQPHAIQATIAHLQSLGDTVWKQLGISVVEAEQLERFNMIGCGTSWYAGRISQFFFEQIARIPTMVHLASEFRSLAYFDQPKSLYLAISQSGETADTLEAIRMLNQLGASTAGLTNVASSTLSREAGGYLTTRAGQEVAVASTKAFSTQIAALWWLAHRIALQKGHITPEAFDQAMKDCVYASQVLDTSIEQYQQVIHDRLAPHYAAFDRYIFLGRHISHPFAMEAALKLQEITYIFALNYPAGELKHGPLALVDASTPVVIFSHLDPQIYQKLLSNAQEVKARGGHLIAFAFEGQDELISLADTYFVFPRLNPLLGPLAMTGLMQYFVYSIARVLERPIDKPRNLAKSVTVE